MIPYTVWSGKEVSHNKLRPFGSVIYFRDHVELDKLKPRYRQGILLGWREDSDSYVRYWDPLKQTVNYSRDVVYSPSDDMNEEAVKNIKTPEDLIYLSSSTTAERTATTPQTPQISTRSLPHTPQPQRFASIEPMSPDTEESFSPSPYTRRSISKDVLEDYHSDGETEAHESSEDELALGKGGVSATYVADSGTPNSFKEARNSDSWPYWKQAITEELSKMDKYQVFKIVPRVAGQHILKGRWVFTRKIDGNTGKVAAFKARWVAKGYAQIEGIHFNDIHASVVHKDSIRVLLALVNYLDYECVEFEQLEHHVTPYAPKPALSCR